MISKERSDQTFGGVFLIGLAILFLTGYWFPGILYVIAAAILARAYAEGKDWRHQDARGALVLVIIGLIFSFGVLTSILSGGFIPVLLIILGVYLLFGERLGLTGKQKRDV